MMDIEVLLKILLIALVLIENWIFFRFCLFNKIFIPIFFKFFVLILILFSINYDWLMLSYIFLNFSISFFTAFIYQPEYRFFFLKYRNIDLNDSIIKRLLGINENVSVSTKFLDELVESVYNLAEKKIGAIVVIERKISLDYYINNGYPISAEVNSSILESIFNKYSPLHDGAIIIRDSKIVAAKCFLPLNTSDILDIEGKVLHGVGARHRAGIGITQNTDAISIVVSETNSAVSFCYDGKMKYSIGPEELYELLKKEMMFHVVPFEKIEKLS